MIEIQPILSKVEIHPDQPVVRVYANVGINGKSLLTGAADPTSTDGQDGEWWINKTALTLFGPKTDGAWPTPGYSLNADAQVTQAQASADTATQAASEASASAAEVNKVASTKARLDKSMLFSWLDSARRQIGSVDTAGDWDHDHTEVRFPGWTFKDRLRLEAPSGKIAVVSSDFRLFGYLDPAADTSTEVQTARGDRATLGERLDQSLDPYGNLRESFNHSSLRQLHYRRRKRLIGESTQLVQAYIGDSYTHNASRYSGPLADHYASELGDAGGGYTGFGFGTAGVTPYASGGNQPTLINGNARAAYGLTFVGTWTSTYAAVPSPDICCANSSTIGDQIIATAPAAPALSGVDLFWIGTADGVIQYSWDNVNWTALNVQGTVGDCSHVALAGVPAGAATLRLKVSGGTCRLAGVNWKSAADGSVLHKLGATGSKAQQWAVQAANASWSAALAALGIHSLHVMHGTNDQGSGRSVDEFKADVGTIFTAALAVMPAADATILMPPENQRGLSPTMASYALAAAELAGSQGYAFKDHQDDFGPASNPAFYASNGVLPLFNVDGIHPEPLTGGRQLADGIIRFHQL